MLRVNRLYFRSCLLAATSRCNCLLIILLYFSREPIPSNWKKNAESFFYIQVGVIGFRRKELIWFLKTKQTPLEKIESVDMNRVLENGKKIKLVVNETLTLGVDTKEELQEIEKILQIDPITRKYIKNPNA